MMKRNIAVWILQVVVAAAFLAAGSSKLAGAAPMVQVFEAVGFGQWFRYLTGLLEIGGAILLLIPGLASFGAITLATVGFGAILAHLLLLGGNAVPAIALFIAAASIARLRREQLRVIAA
jgi:putative oxidoreductase